MPAQSAPSTVVVAPNAGYVILIAAAAAMGGFLFGYDTAVINGAVLALKQKFDASSLAIGLAVSLTLLGSAFGAFVVGPMADRRGRIHCMIVASILFTISGIGSGLPFTLYDFIFWRVIGGIGIGMASVIAPAYIAECSPADMRGRLGSLQQLAIVVGIFAALLGNFAIAGSAGSASAPFWFGFEAWRWMFWSEVPPAIMYGIFALIIPESPRFLVAQGRHAEARVILARMIGPSASVKVEEIARTVRREHKPSLDDLRGRFGLLPIVWVGMGLSMFQQFVGINVIFYYSSTLWQIVGFSEENSLLITMITGFTNIVTTLIAIAFIDRFGRKPLLILGSIGMTITLGAMAWVFAISPLSEQGFPVLSASAGLVALLAANIYVFCFGFSWGPVVWVLLGEMFNNKIRASALALGAGVQWIANFLVSTTFPPIAFNLGLGWAYGLYAGSALLSFFFVYAFIKETKGKELEDME